MLSTYGLEFKKALTVEPVINRFNGELSNWLARLTVNQVLFRLGGSSPSSPTICAGSSMDRIPDYGSGDEGSSPSRRTKVYQI